MSCHGSVVWMVTLLPLALAAPVQRGAAQGREPLRQPSSVPVELATALTSAGGFSGQSDPQILVGALPEWAAARLYVPPRARVLGSAFLGSTVVGVVGIPEQSDTLLARLERELLRRGWSAPPASPSMSGGFRPAPNPMSGSVTRRFTLCGDGQVLTTSIARQRGDETIVLMRLSSVPRVGVCNPPPYRRDSRRPQYPTLFNPEGAGEMRSMMECSSEMGSSFGTGTRLRTTMSSEAVLDHYARQLQDSGWVAAGIAPTVVGRVWTRADSTGYPAVLSITITTSPKDSTCRSVGLNVQTSGDQ